MSSYPNSKDSAGRPGAGITVGCICYVRNLPGDMDVRRLVENGDFVTVVAFIGDAVSEAGSFHKQVWEVTNQKIAAYLYKSRLSRFGVPAKWLVPINDSGLGLELAVENLDDIINETKNVASRIMTERLIQKLKPY